MILCRSLNETAPDNKEVCKLPMKVTIIPVGVLGTNCYFVESDKKNCAIIDPGAQADKLIGLLREAEITPKMILLTHGHYDHIGAVNGLREAYPDVPVYIGELDAEMLSDTKKSHAADHARDSSKYIIRDYQTLNDGDCLTMDDLEIQVLHTPGHTKGGMTYLCGDVMFSGDTLFMGSCGRCDFYGGDYEVMKRSLKRLAELDGDYTVCPGHGDTTTLTQERRSNYYIGEALR